MNAHWIDIVTDQGETFAGYLSLPPTGRGPGLVLIQEIWGVNDHIRTVADQYALDGYVVLAPDVFWRQEPRVDLPYDEAGSAKALALLQRVDAAQAAMDMANTVDTLRGRPELDGKVAVLGFCFGGQLAYRVAAAGKADVAVVYYGGGIQQHLDLVDRITQPILFHHAGRDHRISASAVAEVKARFAGRTNAIFFDYPAAEHGFNCWARPVYQQPSAVLAHGRTLLFLAEHL